MFINQYYINLIFCWNLGALSEVIRRYTNQFYQYIKYLVHVKYYSKTHLPETCIYNKLKLRAKTVSFP